MVGDCFADAQLLAHLHSQVVHIGTGVMTTILNTPQTEARVRRDMQVLIGPSSAAWRRRPGDQGRVAYVTTDGGTTAPPGGGVRRAALLRAELNPATSPTKENR